ncbi:MAG: hypothetical protein AB9869_03670 [Verrucomicrobiia bacterium]
MPVKKKTFEERLKDLGEEVAKNLQAEHGVTERELARVREAVREQWEEEQKILQSNHEKQEGAKNEATGKEEVARAQREEEENRRKRDQQQDQDQDQGHEY